MTNQKSVVAVTHNLDHDIGRVRQTVKHLLNLLGNPLTALVHQGDKVLLKVNMGCGGLHRPAQRMTTHPAVAMALAEIVKDLGGRVLIGDDGTHRGDVRRVWKATGMLEVTERAGAQMVDFRTAGVQEVRSNLRRPKTYTISKAVLDADVVLNVANARSHATFVLSGAIKNMFGAVVGARKSQLHGMFPHPRDFCQIVADIWRSVNPSLSFLDLTSVVEAHGFETAVKPVGLMFASTDPVAMDALAVEAIGYAEHPVWTTIHGAAMSLGCADLEQIEIRGVDWATVERKRLRLPYMAKAHVEGLLDRGTRYLNATWFRPRPQILLKDCLGCRNCFDICPTQAIVPLPAKRFAIKIQNCIDCYCCIKVCEHNAVRLEFSPLIRTLRKALGRPISV